MPNKALLARLSLAVRQQPFARFSVKNHIMKKSFALIIAAGALFLAGCSTCHHHSTVWEYRVVHGVSDSSDLEEKLNKVGSDGFAIESIQTLPAEQNTRPITIVILKKRTP